MPSFARTPEDARTLADEAAEAIRLLNQATLPADNYPCLAYASDAYNLLSALHELSSRMPQLLTQIAAFLMCQLQLDVVTIEDGEFIGDPFGAVGAASHQLEGPATSAARDLARTIDRARQAVAFAASHDLGLPES